MNILLIAIYLALTHHALFAFFQPVHSTKDVPSTNLFSNSREEAFYTWQDRLNAEEIEKVINIISSMPTWSSMNYDTSLRKQALDVMGQLDTYNISTIREAVRQYMDSLSRGDLGDCMDGWGRIFLLNRYLFNAPSHGKHHDRAFGGWAGVPSTEKEKNWLWPLSIDDKGNIAITGFAGGYYGTQYYGL